MVIGIYIVYFEKTINLPQRTINTSRSIDAESMFVNLFKENEYFLYTLAYKLTKSDQTAKDITQEVFLKLWDNIGRVHEINNIEAWLYRLTENKVIDFLRKASADARLESAILA